MGLLSDIGGLFGGGGLLPGLGSAWQADRSSDMADHAMDFTRDQTSAQMAFQERMRATQYQTATADMKAAGLNPMLAYSQGGAGTPAGGAGSGTSANVAAPDSMGGIQSAAQVNLLAKQADNVAADTELKKANLPGAQRSGDLAQKTYELLTEQVGQTRAYKDLNEEQKRQVEKAIDHITQQIETLKSQAGKYDQEAMTEIVERALRREQINDTRVRMTLNLLDVPEAVQRAQEMGGALGKVKPYVSTIGSLIHSASDAKRAFSPATQSFRRTR